MNQTASPSKAELETLELPKTDLRNLIRHFGPGVILMMTGIGTSHLVAAPVAGGRFEFALLWCIPIAYLFKYYGFEAAFRFTYATGRSMLDAYSTTWKRWPLWYVLITTLIQCAIGQAGRLAAASAVVYFFFLEYFAVQLPLALIGLVLSVLSVGIILGGRYGVVEVLAKVFATLLFLSTAAVFFAQPPPLAAGQHFFIFDTPAGSWLLIAAFMGLLPTGIDVSLQASEWGKVKRAGMSRVRRILERNGEIEEFNPFTCGRDDLRIDPSLLPPHAVEYSRRWFKIGIWDFRQGHVFSFLVACVFLLLAAVWIYPSALEGNAVIGEIAGMFTRSIGPWMMIIFLLGSFAATFSTAFNYFDGWPRVVGACCRNLFPETARLSGTSPADLTPEHRDSWYSEFNIYRATMLFSLVGAVAIIAGISRPVWLVLIASALALFIGPVIYFLNLYFCFSVISKHDKTFYPSTFATWFSWASLAVFTALSGVLVLVNIFDINLFG